MKVQAIGIHTCDHVTMLVVNMQFFLFCPWQLICAFVQQIQPNTVELEAILRLITKKETRYACSLLDASQPLLQQLAFHFCDK